MAGACVQRVSPPWFPLSPSAGKSSFPIPAKLPSPSTGPWAFSRDFHCLHQRPFCLVGPVSSFFPCWPLWHPAIGSSLISSPRKTFRCGAGCQNPFLLWSQGVAPLDGPSLGSLIPHPTNPLETIPALSFDKNHVSRFHLWGKLYGNCLSVFGFFSLITCVVATDRILPFYGWAMLHGVYVSYLLYPLRVSSNAMYISK